MKDLKQFNIQFVGLKEGEHSFDYKIDQKFFEAFHFEEFNSADIRVDLNFVKKTTLLELYFKAEGVVEVPCDVSNEFYNQQVDGQLKLVIKFGPEFNDDNEDILIIPHEEYQVNVAQYIYEMIVLAVPNKRVHPQVLDGTMKSEALEKLKELEIKEEKSVEDTDPRWDKLKDLITEK